nr:unnamed protein product [Callosobruchus chinensis]
MYTGKPRRGKINECTWPYLQRVNQGKSAMNCSLLTQNNASSVNMEKFNWTRGDTCLLIENFELYPELWNVHTAEFKDRIKKLNASQ